MKPPPYTRCAIAFLVETVDIRPVDGKRTEKSKNKKKQRCRELVVALPVRLCLLDSAEHPSLSAGVKYRKLLLYNSKSKGSFFFLLPVCVGDFELYFFFMAICMFKELLQEYLKRQEHFQGRVARDALHYSIRLAEIFGI